MCWSLIQRILSPHPSTPYVQRNEPLPDLKWSDTGRSGRMEAFVSAQAFTWWGWGAGTAALSSPLWLLSRRLILRGRIRWRGRAWAGRREENKPHLYRAACEELLPRWKACTFQPSYPQCVLSGAHACHRTAWAEEQCWNPSLLCILTCVYLSACYYTKDSI